MERFLHLIADYGKADPAFSEVIHRLKHLQPDLDIQPTSVPPFATISTGFWIAQYALHNPSFNGLGVYANTAPRKGSEQEREENRGEELVYAELSNGVPVIAVHAGYSFSFIKDEIDQLYRVDVPHKGSQFRSRDFFPEAVVDLLNGDRECLGEQLDPSTIPDRPTDRIAFIDGYGNIKTTLRQSETDFSTGEDLMVTINGESRLASHENNTFEIREGDLAFAPGSGGGDDPFLELFLRGGHAAAAFNYPDVEQTIEWQSAAGNRHT